MADLRPRGSSFFPGLLLLFVGLLLLLHNYRGISIGVVIGHWWALILILWGGVKLYEGTGASRAGDPGAAMLSNSPSAQASRSRRMATATRFVPLESARANRVSASISMWRFRRKLR